MTKIFYMTTGVLVHDHYSPYKVDLSAYVQIVLENRSIQSKRWENLTHEQYGRFVDLQRKLSNNKLVVR